MTIRAITNNDPTPNAGQTPERASAQTVEDPYSEILNPTQAVSEMQLLFSGSRNIQRLREDHPFELNVIPELGSDLLGPMPALEGSPQALQGIINRYRQLRVSLIDRRQNYSHALEGYLKPDEALDLYDRIDQIDNAVIKLDHQLDLAMNKKSQAEFLERDRQLEIQRREEWVNNGG